MDERNPGSGKSCSQHLVLPTRKYPLPRNLFAIPSRGPANQHLWNESIAGARASCREFAAGWATQQHSRQCGYARIRIPAADRPTMCLCMRTQLEPPRLFRGLGSRADRNRGAPPLLCSKSQVSGVPRPSASIPPQLFPEEQSNSARAALAFVDDSRCREAWGGHMMGVPQ